MAGFPEPLKRLIAEFERLPGIGTKSAERLAFAILREPLDHVARFAEALTTARNVVSSCATCANVATETLCAICADPERDASRILVVEHPKDVVAFEVTGRWRGTYHVLLGRLSPSEGAGERSLALDALDLRVAAGGVSELVIGTNPNAEGDATALLLERRYREKVPLTRLSRGLSTGGAIEFAGTEVLAEALRLRRPLGGS